MKTEDIMKPFFDNIRNAQTFLLIFVGCIIFITLVLFGINKNKYTDKFAIYHIYYTNGQVDKIITKNRLYLHQNGCVWDVAAEKTVACYVMKMDAEIDD